MEYNWCVTFYAHFKLSTSTVRTFTFLTLFAALIIRLMAYSLYLATLCKTLERHKIAKPKHISPNERITQWDGWNKYVSDHFGFRLSRERSKPRGVHSIGRGQLKPEPQNNKSSPLIAGVRTTYQNGVLVKRFGVRNSDSALFTK